MCRSSIDLGECFDAQCTLQHLKGTVRGYQSLNARGISRTTHNTFRKGQLHKPNEQNRYKYPLQDTAYNARFVPPTYHNSMKHQEMGRQVHHTYNNYSQNFPPLPTQEKSYDGYRSTKPAALDGVDNKEDSLFLIMNQLKDLQQQNILFQEELNVIKSRYQNEIGQRNHQASKNLIESNGQFRS